MNQNAAVDELIEEEPTQFHDLDYTQRIINYLQASYQGRFAMLNIFSRTSHKLFKQSEVEKTQKILRELHGWEQEILGKRLIFPIANAQDPKGKEHKAAHEYLKAIKPELESLAKKVKEILTSKSMFSENEDAFLLLATFARNAYCRDNYVRGFIRFGEKIGDRGLVDGYKMYLMDVKDHVDAINELLILLKKNDNVFAPEHTEYLAFLVRTLPGVFRAHVHDIKQLLAGPYDPFSFQTAGFFKMEAEAWAQAGYSAIEAGYWRAHEVSIDEAQQWTSLEVVDPTVVAEWKTASFPADIARQWIDVLFAPILAIRWANEGYSPREAAVLVMSGFKLPKDVPPDQVLEILEEGFRKLAERELPTVDPDKIAGIS